jgi:carbonic anhydrase/acetyltransferase-like protein (isoleucine patch superfamily)
MGQFRDLLEKKSDKLQMKDLVNKNTKIISNWKEIPKEVKDGILSVDKWDYFNADGLVGYDGRQSIFSAGASAPEKGQIELKNFYSKFVEWSGEKVKVLEEFFNESIKVTQTNSIKYFKLIKKGTKSKTWNIVPFDNSYVVEFRGGKEWFNLLVDTTKGKDGWLVGYQFGENDGTFKMFPTSFTSAKDILSNYNILKSSKEKSEPQKKVIKKAHVQIDLTTDVEDKSANEKYRMIKEGKLFRIYATKSFADVKIGDKGGLVTDDNILSIDGDCWIYDGAKAVGNVKVFDNAKVYNGAKVLGNVKVYDDAEVYGKAEVYGDAEVFEDARVYGNAEVYGNVEVYDDTEVFGDKLN